MKIVAKLNHAELANAVAQAVAGQYPNARPEDVVFTCIDEGFYAEIEVEVGATIAAPKASRKAAAVVEEDVEEEAPKPTRSRRKAAAVAEPEPEEDSEEEEEEKPAPRRRGFAKKAEVVEEEDEADEVDSPLAHLRR